MPSQDPCHGYDSFLLSSHDEWQTGHIHSEQDGGVNKSPFLGAKPCGYHTGQSLVVHCSPCQTRHGGNPLADLSEKIWKKCSILCILLVNSLSCMISQMPFECFPLLSVPGMSQAWVCIVRQSRAGLLLGNTICSARAIFKCPLVVIPLCHCRDSPLSLLNIPWDLLWDICTSARTVPALLAPMHSQVLHVLLHCQVLQQNHQHVPDFISAAGQDSPGS